MKASMRGALAVCPGKTVLLFLTSSRSKERETSCQNSMQSQVLNMCGCRLCSHQEFTQKVTSQSKEYSEATWMRQPRHTTANL